VPSSTELRLIPAHQLRGQGFNLETDCAHAEIEPRPASNGIRWVDDFLIFDAVRDGRADAGVLFEPMLDHPPAISALAPLSPPQVALALHLPGTVALGLSVAAGLWAPSGGASG
jgi:hypothetical protein